MFIAKVTDTGIEIAEHTSMLPNTSFGVGGPTLAQIEEFGYLQVNVWKPYSHATEKLVAVAPYIEYGQVFTVQVEKKTQEELDADIASFDAADKAARAEAYRTESDPLFFKAQRGEATMEEWIAKVAEIKARGQNTSTVETIGGA